MRAKPVDPHLVAVVDGNPRHRQQVSEALLSFYAVNAYGDVTNALMGLRVAPPGIVLVGEHVPPTRGVTFLRSLRQEWVLAQTPVIFVSDSGDPENLQAALSAGATDCLLKPYRRSALLKIVSTQLNAKVEGQWKSLLPRQRNALEGTLGIFNSIADVVDAGSAIQYMAVAECCTSLVDAVATSGVQTVSEAVVAHDNSTYAHSLRTAVFLVLFAQAIGLSRAQQLLLAAGGLLHDVGKMSIRHAVLNKQGKLTDEEWDIIRGHVPASVGFLRACGDMPKGVVTIAADHHERLDGSGYPRGLSGSQLNELARMAAIVDVFAFLTDAVVYRPRMQPEAALKKMTEEMSTQLDADMLARFRTIVLDSLKAATPRESLLHGAP